jgi:hypothetical protein
MSRWSERRTSRWPAVPQTMAGACARFGDLLAYIGAILPRFIT